MKAVLLIDMPSNCYECPLRTQEFDLYYSHYACQDQYTTIHEKEGDVEKIQKTCPLKPLNLDTINELESEYYRNQLDNMYVIMRSRK